MDDSYEPTDHLAAIEAHLRDNDAKHSPVIVTILTVLRAALAGREDREPLSMQATDGDPNRSKATGIIGETMQATDGDPNRSKATGIIGETI